MALLLTKFNIPPSNVGLLYKKNEFIKELSSGMYWYFNPVFYKTVEVHTIPTHELWTLVTNQEVLTKDNIALRFSYNISYTITEPKKYIDKAGPPETYGYNIPSLGYQKANEAVHMYSQIVLREKLAKLESAEINENRAKLFSGAEKTIQKDLDEYGIEINTLLLRDITFPKRIQDLFSLQLEAEIRSQSDLKNARTQVATARALKNASEILKKDENIKFLQYLETINKIAGSGKHTFVFGEQTLKGA